MFERRVIEVEGVVQGVGFRPFVFRLAKEGELTGYVLNDERGVVMELQGGVEKLNQFEKRLFAELPSGGRIEHCESHLVTPDPLEKSFVIRKSHNGEDAAISLVPDRALCSECLGEITDSSNRRYRYPFTNCTACGPRYTISMELPYDRPNTTMAEFEMCDNCRTEYENPENRRYHAQPNACPDCGPSVTLRYSETLAKKNAEEDITKQNNISGDAALEQASELLRAGYVVAVKGIGGFHLAADANNEKAVNRLRKLKKRPRKPLAVMAASLQVARSIVHLDSKTEQLLLSPKTPIVLARRKRNKSITNWLAPGLSDLGVMLPYTPLHFLLFQNGLDLLVMTSGNHPSEPITINNDDALERLSADGFLLHNREIHVANDDSVVRTSSLGPILVRRSRGYVPEAMPASQLPKKCSILALGAELKSTVSTLHAGQLIVGRHLGNLNNLRAEEAFATEVERMLRFARFEPDVVAVDHHPDLASTRYAHTRLAHKRIHAIQHHHAHMASTMLEHGIPPDTEVTGIILDGIGLGLDNAVWGGEVLRGGYSGFKRVAHLRYVPLPGGDRAAVEPYRMATSLLVDAGYGEGDSAAFDAKIAQICKIGSASPPTSSAGRLFDGVSALLGIAPRQTDYEGEAAARLETLANGTASDGYPLPLIGDELDTRILVRALMADASAPAIRASRFINGLADGLVDAAMAEPLDTVVLGGGCFINRDLLNRLVFRLRGCGKRVFFPERLPCGDGGLSAGQAACAACAKD